MSLSKQALKKCCWIHTINSTRINKKKEKIILFKTLKNIK